MVRPKVKGVSPLSLLNSRQIGDNIHNFRQNLFRERLANAKNLYRQNLLAHFGCVNAIEFSNDGDLLISGGDDRRVLLWKLEESMAGVAEPRAMKNHHYSNIFCLGFNNDSSKIFSGGNDDAVIVHDVKTGEPYDVFLHSKPVYGLSVDVTNDQIFSTAGEDGRVLVFDLRIGTQVLALPKSRASYHGVEFHPYDGNFMVTANGKDGSALWDIRDYNMPLIRYGGQNGVQSCMSVRFNSHGSQVLALRRRLPPILYNTFSQDSICQFYHPDYYNSCTMKSCCFAGESDEYVLSGSDDFNLYVWRVNEADCNKTSQWVDTHHMVLYGHRSIVNQVRYNPQKCMIASSGVEKVIKLWRPFELKDWDGSLAEETNGPTNARDIFSHEEYVSLLNASGQNMTHDYSHQNTTEDPRMMAFFDSLVQREIEGWKSNENSDTDKSSLHSSDGSSRPTSTLQSESDSATSFQVLARDSYRRNRTALKSRSKYSNRIAYLIATKRNTLKRLALKGSVQITRRVKSLKNTNRKLQRSSIRLTRKGTSKRTHRAGNNSKTRSRDCNDYSENEMPKKIAKRRIQQHLNPPAYRMNRRISKILSINYGANYESDDTSSSDDEANSDSPNNNNLPSSSKVVLQNTTNESNGIVQSNNNRESPTRFPIPSTSTGITGNGTLFRIAQTPDSDDDPTPQNSPPLSQSTMRLNHPTPVKVNGIHKFNNAYSSGVDDEQPNETRHSRRKRNHSLTNNYHYNNNNFSSHSSSRLSDSSSSDDDDASSNDSSMPFFCNNLSKKQKFANGEQREQQQQQIEQNNQTASTLTRLERTPIASRSRDTKGCEFTPDSGFVTTPGSSTSCTLPAKQHSDGNNNSNTNNNGNNSNRSSGSKANGNHKINGDDSIATSMKLFQQNVSRIRRNFRNIGEASYSEDSD